MSNVPHVEHIRRYGLKTAMTSDCIVTDWYYLGDAAVGKWWVHNDCSALGHIYLGEVRAGKVVVCDRCGQQFVTPVAQDE